ncbi:hypothetical protein SAMN05428964_101908 [Thalassospira xiamenensis]|uniref:Uncharacterized protein n=1 Tax=Thalassospira xiamenensis TaxID=220697 RepID=A0A285RIZ0_9PROT|nr:hypothetical protein SAMN05428964_101908 [Thalassospira xiamenensis]
MTDLSARPNAPSASPPTQSNPAREPRCPLHRQTPPNRQTTPRTLLPRTSTARSRLTPQRHLTQGQQRYRMAGTNPAVDDRSFGITRRSTNPTSKPPRCPRHRQTPPAGWAGLDGTGLHQTDLAPVPAAPNKRLGLSMDTANAPHPKGKNAVAWQAHVPPSMTGLPACPNAPAAPSPSQAIQPADPMQTQFGPADTRHCQTSPTGLNRTCLVSPRLSLPERTPLPHGHISPVMINHSFRKSLVASRPGRTTAVMTFPCASGVPLTTPPPPFHPVRSLSHHRLIPVLPPET